jgi:hypothetical protein
MSASAGRGLSATVDFLDKRAVQLVRFGGLAERYFCDDSAIPS